MLKLHIFPHHRSARLILFIQRHFHVATLNLPPTYVLYEAFELRPRDVQPALQHFAVHFLHTLAHDHGDTDTHNFLETLHIGNEVSVEIIGVEGRPEVGVCGVVEVVVQDGEMLDGFCQCAGGGWAVGFVCCCEGVGGEEGEAEAEVWGGEDGQGFDEDVGCCFVAG